MFILSSIASGLEFWSVNHTSMYKNSELKVFNNKRLLTEISNNWPAIHLEQMYRKLSNLVENHCLQHLNGLILLQ